MTVDSLSPALCYFRILGRERERGKENRKKIIGQSRAAFKWRPIRHSLSLSSMLQDFLSLPSYFCCLDAVITEPNQVDGRGKAQSGFHSSKKKRKRKKENGPGSSATGAPAPSILVKVLEWPEARDQHFSRSFSSFFYFLGHDFIDFFSRKDSLLPPVRRGGAILRRETHTLCVSLYRQFFSRIE